MPCLLPTPGAPSGSCCRNERARRPRRCDSAAVGPCQGPGDSGLHTGLPPRTLATSRATPSLPRGRRALPFPPPCGRSRPPARRGLPLVACILPVARRCGSCPRPHVRIHMDVSRGQQLPAGCGVRGAVWSRAPLASRASPVSLPPSIPPRSPAVPMTIAGRGAGPVPRALLRGRKIFSLQ